MGGNGRKIQHWQVMAVLLALYDACAVNLSFFLALWLRFDCRISEIPADYLMPYLHYTLIYTALSLVTFFFCGLYSAMWRYASFMELERIVLSSFICFILQFVGIGFFVRHASAEFTHMPWSYYFVGIMIQFLLIIAARFSYRFLLLVKDHRHNNESGYHPVMLIGAGSAGRAIIREMNRFGRGNDRVVCIIDDDANKWKRFIDGIPIVGGRDLIMQSAEHYHVEKIYIAIPSAAADDLKEILNVCKETDCSLKLLRGMYQMVDEDRISVRDLKDVSIEDLLGRDPIHVEMKEIYDYINGRVIMVTGGGGSIGSELCRQIAKHSPGQLVIFDIYENNAYEIQQELKRQHPELKLSVIIGSVRDKERLFQVFEEYRPQIVYHAAAHKHVPLMEDSPAEAVKNNAAGTYNTGLAALKYGVERFVLISTDKAVNPVNIMGASKRLCEMVIQSFDAKVKNGTAAQLKTLTGEDAGIGTDAKTEFVAVRFGNVLGSNGSVVPLFREQIAQGGPVTVTHPDIIRYFMTIPEAVSLVMQAGTYAKGGEIFVLDMGSPVKIDTLARNLIRLSGLKPDEDIKIVYTGLRPGEKMFEEKLMEEEGLKTTPNKLIHIGNPVAFDTEVFLEKLKALQQAALKGDKDIKRLVAGIVDTYRITGE